MTDTEGSTPHLGRRYARVLLGVSLLLLLATGGEVLARVTRLPLPGSVIGLVVLALAFMSPVSEWVEKVIAPGADLLIVMLPLLLVPLAVGVLDLAGVVGEGLIGLAVSLLGGWLAAFAVTVAVYLLFRRRAAR